MRWDERIGQRLKLRHLHTLQAIAEAGSMVKAAERLAISQPAISKAIADMEHTLGVPLLDRTPRGVEVTAYGRVLLKRSDAIFDDLRQGLAEIEHLKDPTRGELRIGAPEPIAPVLSVIIDELTRQYPRIRFHATIGDTTILFRELRERTLDIAFTRMLEPDAERDMQAEVLYEDPLVVMAGGLNPWPDRREVTLAELVDEPWTFSPPDTFLGRFADEAFRERGLDLPQASVITPSIQMRISLLTTGRYLSILPGAMLRFPIQNAALRSVRVDLAETRRPVGLVMLKGRSQSPVARLFVEAARSVTSTLNAAHPAL
jgi:DNA-binding transcriptional LysR family regulator